MRRLILSLAIASASAFPIDIALAADAAETTNSPAVALTPNSGKKPVSDREQFAYSIGYLNGQGSAEQLPDLDIETFMRGFRDAFAKMDSLLSPQERTTAINRYKEQRLTQLKADMAKLAKDNAAEAAAFLETNAKADGIAVTASGLQYRVIKASSGAKPKAKDSVKVHYEGRFIDGHVFDSSYNRGEPAVFRLDKVLPGWTEGLQLMSVGSTYELYIPPTLAYGESGAGPIPPNKLLHFKVELLSIEKGSTAKTKQ